MVIILLTLEVSKLLKSKVVKLEQSLNIAAMVAAFEVLKLLKSKTVKLEQS